VCYFLPAPLLQVFASPARRGGFAGLGLGLVEWLAASDTEVSVDLHPDIQLDAYDSAAGQEGAHRRTR